MQVEWAGPRWENVAALGGLRGGRAETLVEKVSEFGAWSLRPLLTNRSQTIGMFSEFGMPLTNPRLIDWQSGARLHLHMTSTEGQGVRCAA